MSNPNLNDPEFDELREHPGFNARRARLGHQLATQTLGASLWEVDPGEAAYPYHAHLAEEELLFILEGTPSLRTPSGWREVEPGEVLSFPRGEEGAHQVVNRSEEGARVLIVSEMNSPEIVVRPESGKLSAMGRPPGDRGRGMHRVFHERDEAPFWEDEDPPPGAS